MQLLFHCLTFYEDITWTNFLKFYLHSPTQFQHYGYMTLPPHQIAQPSFHYSQWYEIKMYTVRVDYRGISYESSWELTPQIYQLNAHTHTHTHTYIYLHNNIFTTSFGVLYTTFREGTLRRNVANILLYKYICVFSWYIWGVIYENAWNEKLQKVHEN